MGKQDGGRDRVGDRPGKRGRSGKGASEDEAPEEKGLNVAKKQV